MNREEIFELLEEMGNMLKIAAQEGLDDPSPGIPVHPYTHQMHLATMFAMSAVGDLVQDWARDKLLTEEINQCPFTHAHTKHWCGYEGCRES